MKKPKSTKKAITRNTKATPVKKGQGSLFNKGKVKKAVSAAKAKAVKKGQGGVSDNKKDKATTPAAVAEPTKKGRGGLRDYSEGKAQKVQRVRGEFLSDTFKPKITFSYKNVTFNMACVNIFKNCQHVSLGIDLKNLRLIVEPAKDYDKDALKFANMKNGRNIPRTSTTRYFCLKLFDEMNWNLNAKYRILTVFQEFDDKKVMVFNLDEAQQVFSEVQELENGKKKRSTTVQMPLDWKDRFGYTMDELDAKMRVTLDSTFITIDPKTGEKVSGNIASKRPTAEELIHEPYGGIRPRKKESKK
jgi:hypothetical protein